MIQKKLKALRVGDYRLTIDSENDITTASGFKKRTVTILTTDWTNNQATITVEGLKSTDIVWVSPTEDSYFVYTINGVRAISQGTETLTFETQYSLTENITVLIIFGE